MYISAKTLLMAFGLFFFTQFLAAQGLAPAYVTMGTHYGQRGDTVCLPVQCHNFDSIVGFQFAHNWDSTKLAFVSVSLQGTWATGSFFGYNSMVPGNCRVGFNVIQLDDLETGISLPDSSVLYQLCLRVLFDTLCTSVVTNGDGMDITTPPAIENAQGINLYSEAANTPGQVCIGEASGVVNVASARWMRVYPNPFADLLLFENEQTEAAQITVFNTLGITVATASVNGGNTWALPASHWGAGAYFWQATRDGRTVAAGKLIK